MAWLDLSSKIPIGCVNFDRIIDAFVFNCPSSQKTTGKKELKKTAYKPVSARAETFRKRGIEGSLLTAITKQINTLLNDKLIKTYDDVITTIQSDSRDTTTKDLNYNIIVYKQHPNMSDAEAVYYYIRCAFAHGSFEVKEITKRKRVYILEAKSGNSINAQMRLTEKALIDLITIAQQSAGDIKSKSRIKSKIKRGENNYENK